QSNNFHLFFLSTSHRDLTGCMRMPRLRLLAYSSLSKIRDESTRSRQALATRPARRSRSSLPFEFHSSKQARRITVVSVAELPNSGRDWSTSGHRPRRKLQFILGTSCTLLNET